MKKLSIITPHFNVPDTIQRTIESIPNELSDDIEHIIIDDCSTTQNYKFLKDLTNNYKHIKLFKNKKNVGPIITINEGARLASGDYILFLSADDWLDVNFLETFVERIGYYKKPGVVLGDVCSYYEDKDTQRRIRSFPDKSPRLYEEPSYRLSSGLTVRLHGQSALRKDLFFQFGPYDLDLRWNSDLFLHSKIALSNGILYLPVVHGYFSKRLHSYGSSKSYKQQSETLGKLMLLLSETKNTELKKLYIKSGCLGREVHTLRYLIKHRKFDYLTVKYFVIRIVFTLLRTSRKINRPWGVSRE